MLRKIPFGRRSENLIQFMDNEFFLDGIHYDRDRIYETEDGQVIQPMFQLKRDYLEREDSEGYVEHPQFSSPMCWIQDSYICKCKKIGCSFIHEVYDGRSSP